MRKNNGWIKQYRNSLDNPVIMKSSAHFAVWSLLLLMANTSPKSIVFNGKEIVLQPGQLVTGRKEVNNKLKDLNESKIERILNMFENAHQIEQQKTNRGRLITITNWDKYQKTKQQTGQQVNNNRTTSEQQTHQKRTLNKNIKNIKNVKKCKSVAVHADDTTQNVPYKSLTAEEVIDLYNSICVSLPKVTIVTQSIKESIKDIYERFVDVDYGLLFKKVEESDFLTGRKTNWKCNLNWILMPTNFDRIRSGEFDDFKKKEKSEERNASYDLDMFESKSLFKD